MIPSGIFIRADHDGLDKLLAIRLAEYGPAGLKVESPGTGKAAGNRVCLKLTRWSDKWCLLEAEGHHQGVDLVLEVLLNQDPLEEVLTSRFSPGAEEYGYTLYRAGRVIEMFNSRGPGVETIHFVSELRRVPLQTLMNASGFMAASMADHGVSEDSRIEPGDTMRIDFLVPGKPTFLQSILGAACRR